MLINSDFFKRAVISAHEQNWVASPQPGVHRVMLDRIGEEKAAATSLVRYAEKSFFPRHEHPGGEEILVLSGVFSEGALNYSTGWYLRNPPGTSHAPSSAEGAVIFVKLRQFPDSDTSSVRIDTNDSSLWKHHPERDVCELYVSDYEHVSLQKVGSLQPIIDDNSDGAELLLLDGELTEDGILYTPGTWIRLPPGELPLINAGHQGAKFYLKKGHLRHRQHAAIGSQLYVAE